MRLLVIITHFKENREQTKTSNDKLPTDFSKQEYPVVTTPGSLLKILQEAKSLSTSDIRAMDNQKIRG